CDEESRLLRNRINWLQLSVFQKAKTGKHKFFKLAIQLSKVVLVTLQVEIRAILFLNTFGDISLYDTKIIETSKLLFFGLEQEDTPKKIFTKGQLTNNILLAFDHYLTLKSNPKTNSIFFENQRFNFCFKLSKLNLFAQKSLAYGYKYGQNCFNIEQTNEINQHINQTIFSSLFPLLAYIEYQVQFRNEQLFKSKLIFQKRCSKYLIKDRIHMPSHYAYNIY
ncbi:hypothetical protein MXB_5541, partial [Myxobolus squamalis]